MSGMPTPASITIDDLDAPVLPDGLRESMERSVAETPFELSVDCILSRAAEQTGLSDFGEDDFQEPLQRYLDAVAQDADLSAFGRLTAFNILVRSATTRLRVEDAWRQHPEIDEQRIEQPIIIVGLPRSGTTHLLNLISCDHRLNALPYWETLEPVPLPGEAEDARVQRCAEALAAQDLAMPHFSHMHEMTAWHVHEEIELAGMASSTMLYENYAIVPAWRDYYLATDQTRAYRYIQRTLKLLQWYRGNQKRWILKSPAHMEQYHVLAQLYPDATYVITHRDPMAVLASLCTMLAYSARLSRDPVRPGAIAEYWADRVGRMLDACTQSRGLLPAKQSLDVHFDEFMADDVSMVESIFDIADHGLPFEVRTRMREYSRENPRGKRGAINYDLVGDFGIDPEAWRGRYRPYMERFGIRQE